MARSRRRNGSCEFSARLLSRRPTSWRSALPISFIAAGYEQSPSVTIFRGRPYLFMIRLRSFSAAVLSRFAVTTASKTSPSCRRRAKDSKACRRPSRTPHPNANATEDIGACARPASFGSRQRTSAAPEIHFTQSPGQRSPTVKRELRRRAAVEPIIGHAKSDGLLERNRLAGARGDAINAILVGAGHNIRLLLAWLRLVLRLLLLDLAAIIEADISRRFAPPALV